MLLNELTGYRQFQNQDFHGLMAHLEKLGVHNAGGWFGAVVIPPSKPYVYKCWFNDPGYETFINYVKSHQSNKMLPQLKGSGRVHKVPLFFKRPDTVDGYLKVIRLERLRQTSHLSEQAFSALEEAAQILAAGSWTEPEFISWYDEHIKPELGHAQLDPAGFYQVMYDLNQLIDPDDDQIDMHQNNFMLRGDQLVITDPLAGNLGTSLTLRMLSGLEHIIDGYETSHSRADRSQKYNAPDR